MIKGGKRDPNINHLDVYTNIINRECNCNSNCIKQFSINDITQIRNKFIINKSYNDIKLKFIEYFKTEVDLKKKRISYTLMGKKVCRCAFCLLVGINDESLNKYKKLSVLPILNLNNAINHNQNQSELITFFSAIDDSSLNIPNKEKKSLPSYYSSKQDVYLEYYDFCNVKNFQALCRRTFFKYWEKHYPNIIIENSDYMICSICENYKTNKNEESKIKLEEHLNLSKKLFEENKKIFKKKIEENELKITMDGCSSIYLPYFKRQR